MVDASQQQQQPQPEAPRALTPFDQPCPHLTPSFEEIGKAVRPTLLHVPRGAIDPCVQTYTKLLTAFNETPAWETLHRLWAFPKCVLVPLKRGGKAHWAAVGRAVAQRARRYAAEGPGLLWTETAPENKTARVQTRQETARKERASQDAFADRIAKSVGNGAISRACQLLMSDGVQDSSNEKVMDNLRKLHPHEAPPNVKIPDNIRTLEFPMDPETLKDRLVALRKAIFSFPKESAAGPSGLKPDHLKSMIGDMPGDTGEQLLAQLDRFVCKSLEEGRPPEMAEILCAARLTPLRKVQEVEEVIDAFGHVCNPPSTEESTRPIAAGETLRRLTGKVLMRHPEILQAFQELQPPQVGVGVASACPLAAMATQQIVNAMTKRGLINWAIMKIDFANAFNTAYRKTMLDNIVTMCPQALPWMTTCYNIHSPLFVGQEILRSQRGQQQGDPCGPAGFCWSIQDMLEAIAELVEWQVWYLDDGLIVGTIEQLDAALRVIIAMGEARGLQVNLQKCELWGPALTAGMPADISQQNPLRSIPVIPWEPHSGTKVLGVPICYPTDDAFAQKVWNQRVQKMDRIMQVLQQLPQSHIQYTLLKYCLSACRVNDLMRACPINHAVQQCAAITKLLRDSMQGYVGTVMSSTQWEQTRLAIRCGGLGIMDPSHQRPAARISCIVNFLQAAPRTLGIEVDDDMMPWDMMITLSILQAQLGNKCPIPAWTANPKEAITAQAPHTEQEWWGQQVHLATKEQLERDLQAAQATRFHCQTMPHANSWLAVIPCAPKRTLMPTVEFRCLLRWTLGMELSPEPDQHQQLVCPRCENSADTSGHHLVCCHQNNITRRHYGLADKVYQIVKKAGYTVRKEQKAPDGTRPGDIFLPRYDSDGPAAVDFTIRDPLAPSNPCITDSRIKGWHEAQEDDKVKKYGRICQSKGWAFIPFVMDVHGGMAPQARKFMQTMIKATVGQKEGWQRRQVEASMWQEVEFEVMKDIAKQLVWSVQVLAEDKGAPQVNQPYR
jgi:hypothetical protein